MTHILPEHLKCFQELFKSHFGVDLNDRDTQENAEELVSLVKMLLLPNRKELGKK